MNDMIFGFQMLGNFQVRTDRHRLAGTVTVDGVPAKRLVAVLNRATLGLIASTISDSSGAWEIFGISEYPERALLVLAIDNTGNYNAEVADFVTQVASE